MGSRLQKLRRWFVAHPALALLLAAGVLPAQQRSYSIERFEARVDAAAAEAETLDDLVAGVDYVLDIGRPVGSRVTSLTRNGRPVSDSDSFTLALHDYRQQGGGGFTMLAGAPVVYAEWPAPAGMPTLVLYSHYDVISPEPVDQWTYPPSSATRIGGQGIGRGSTDANAKLLALILDRFRSLARAKEPEREKAASDAQENQKCNEKSHERRYFRGRRDAGEDPILGVTHQLLLHQCDNVLELRQVARVRLDQSLVRRNHFLGFFFNSRQFSFTGRTVHSLRRGLRISYQLVCVTFISCKQKNIFHGLPVAAVRIGARFLMCNRYS